MPLWNIWLGKQFIRFFHIKNGARNVKNTVSFALSSSKTLLVLKKDGNEQCICTKIVYISFLGSFLFQKIPVEESVLYLDPQKRHKTIGQLRYCVLNRKEKITCNLHTSFIEINLIYLRNFSSLVWILEVYYSIICCCQI